MTTTRGRTPAAAQPLRWGTIETPFAVFAAWVDEQGRLVRFDLSARGAEHAEPGAVHDEAAIEHVRRQVLEYAAGERRVFELERAARGTPFQHLVWEAVAEIPFGATASYGQVARAIGRPKAARAVGLANATNPIALIVPCHRVIGSDGSLTGYGGGLPLKRALLAHEARFSRREDDLFANTG
ncbi:MAG TPA: methylated-DNA--[protein]-cysteine S-methyltransferase [Gammaproteobacteria bacterium]